MNKNHYIIPIFISHQGCPHQCVFCNQVKIAGTKDIDVSTDEVIKTINTYLETISNKDATIEVSFFGGTFTAICENKQKQFLGIAKEYKEKKLINKIRLSTRPDAISDYILNYLKEFSVDVIELGVQSLDDEILKLSGRGHSSNDVYLASKLIKEYGFILGHQIMLGLPGDDFDKDIETVKKSISMKPNICRIYPALVIKDTPMEKMYNREEYTPYTLNEAIEISSSIMKMYKDAKVKIIRVGLQPTESINFNGDIIDGPFHPSFKELVEGYTICKEIGYNIDSGKDLLIEINEKDISKLYANKKEYFKKFIVNSNRNVKVRINNKLKRNKVNISVIEETKNINI